jgi:outer membrane protein OmpA-like peptidoglycan-associated protein
MKYSFLLLAGTLLSLIGKSQEFTTPSLIPVNSAWDEQNPVLSPDRKTLWYTIANHPQNTAGKKDPGDIWYSRWENGQWSVPIHGGALLNDRGYNGVAGLSAAGDRLFLFNHYNNSGSAQTQGISVSSKTNSGWSAPENITIPYFLNRSLALSGQVSADGTVFIYAAEAYDSKGAEDIYVSLKNSAGQWSEPRNVGTRINSSFQELSPWLSADKKYLYFSSNGRKGYGSFDVYVSERLDETWTNWSAPSNMGSRVNTEGRELFYHTFPDLRLALFTSTQNSDGYGDIKFYNDSIQSTVPDRVVKIVEIKRENVTVKDTKHAIIAGAVTNSRTGQPVEAKLEFRSAKPLPDASDSAYTTNSDKQGMYSLRISSTSVYTIVLEAAGYVGILEKLDIHTLEMQQVELNFKLQPIEVGATVNLKNVLFTVGTTTLLSESYDELNVVVNLLKTNPGIEIELAGHTDNRGDARKNLKLSQSRVDKVKSYLVSKGIPARRIKGKGYGGQHPIANSESEESRKLNRRVEFTIVKD